LLTAWSGLPLIDGLRAMFVLYGLLGGAIWLLYRGLPITSIRTSQRNEPLGPSRGLVIKLAALFSVDAFAGGLVVNSLLTLWLFERFGLSLGQAGLFFFCTGLLSAVSQLAAPAIACRIGLLNTMVFTHIPANVCLIFAAVVPNMEVALALLFAQMDVPTRTAYVMAVVTPAERAAAASFTAVPRSLASAASPTLAGALLAGGLLTAPLLVCGTLKIVYDLALLVSFRRMNVPLDRK
jgi:hypothetical protein